ncbi:MAG: glycine zipper 2TM domain-containing protein [Burkholderiaceae bacterium]
MNLRPIATTFCLTALAAVAACSSAPQRYEPVAQAPVPAAVPVYYETGRVRSIEVIPVAARSSGGGAVLGAIIGGVIGHQIGGGTGKALATGAGAVGGAVAGNAIEMHNKRDDEVFRVSVRFEDGSVRSYDFQRIDDLRVGDRVKLEGGQIHRM